MSKLVIQLVRERVTQTDVTHTKKPIEETIPCISNATSYPSRELKKLSKHHCANLKKQKNNRKVQKLIMQIINDGRWSTVVPSSS